LNAVVLLLGVSVVLAVAAIGLSLFTAWRTKALVEFADKYARVRMEEIHAATAVLQKTVDGQTTQFADLQHQPHSGPAPGPPRFGLNLCKRSQVLRMHRKGDATDHIAATLDVPLQEVNLLIKVHRIVIGSL
jgi:hypothetical protein